MTEETFWQIIHWWLAGETVEYYCGQDQWGTLTIGLLLSSSWTLGDKFRIKPKWREPIMPDDYNKRAEMRDSDCHSWKVVTICGYAEGHDFPWLTKYGRFKQARIKCDD